MIMFIYLSIYTTKTCDFNKSHSTNETHEEPKTCGSSKPTNFTFVHFFLHIFVGCTIAIGYSSNCIDCNMIFIQSYWFHFYFFPIICYNTIHHSLKICVAWIIPRIHPMGDFFWGITCDVKPSQTQILWGKSRACCCKLCQTR
jgi:hypothetical protein